MIVGLWRRVSSELSAERQESYELQDGTMSDSAMVGAGVAAAGHGLAAKAAAAAFAAEAKRKKSLMTRLIPGRGNAAGAFGISLLDVDCLARP